MADLDLDRCPIRAMEQSVLDFINCMIMEEDKCTDARPFCLLDDNSDAAAVALYQAIWKGFADIVADNFRHNASNTIFTPPSSSAIARLPTNWSRTISDDDSDYYHRKSDLVSAAVVEGDPEELSSSARADEFGIWVDKVLSSATLVTADDLDVLQPAYLSAAEPSKFGYGVASGATASYLIHDLHQSKAAPPAGAVSVDLVAATALRVAPAQQLLEPKLKEFDFYFNEELGEVIQEEYEDLYAEAWDLQGGAGPGKGRKSDHGTARSRSGAAGSNKRKGSASVSAPGYYDLEELLLGCAQAVARSDSRQAREILVELRRQGASAQGRSCLHRMAFHFCRALEARLDGTGATLYAAEIASFASVTTGESLRAWLRMFDSWHYIKISQFFSNQSFLAESHGKARLHIVDYGIRYGSQWAYLIKALSEREGGPPLLIVTGVQFPDSPNYCNVRVKSTVVNVVSTGRRLAEFAAACGVPFEWHGVESTRWEDLDGEALGIDLGRRSETALVCNVMKQLQFIPDETVMYGDLQRLPGGVWLSPRQKLLCQIRSLNPDLFVVGVMNAGFNVPTFLTRFKEALQHYSSILDMMDVSTEESPEKQLMERLFARGILNVVACEGADRVVRPETYRQWQRRLQRAGFQQLPVPESLLRRSVRYVREKYHRDCTVMEDHSSPWLLMGWRGRTYMAMSSWRPSNIGTERNFEVS